MNLDKTLFAQIMEFLPWKTFHRFVYRHDRDRYATTVHQQMPLAAIFSPVRGVGVSEFLCKRGFGYS